MYKTKLQELCQRRHWTLPDYETVREGPDHNPRFSSTVTVDGNPFRSSSPARSAKLAQNAAAMVAFNHFSQPPPDPIPVPNKPIIPSIPNLTSFPQPSLCAPSSPSPSGSPGSSIGVDSILPTNKALQPKLEGCLTSQSSCPVTVFRDTMIERDQQSMLHLYKNQLQSYAQKRNVNLPVYSSEWEGPPHALRFKCKVTIDGQTYESSKFYSTLKDAEHAAAEVALMSLSPGGVQEDHTVIYKNLLQELVQKKGYRLPIYTTTKSGEAHMPIFVSQVEVAGEYFTGQEAKSKKQAEMSAAKVAYTTLKECKASMANPVLRALSLAKANPNPEDDIEVDLNLGNELQGKTEAPKLIQPSSSKPLEDKASEQGNNKRIHEQSEYGHHSSSKKIKHEQLIKVKGDFATHHDSNFVFDHKEINKLLYDAMQKIYDELDLEELCRDVEQQCLQHATLVKNFQYNVLMQLRDLKQGYSDLVVTSEQVNEAREKALTEPSIAGKLVAATKEKAQQKIADLEAKLKKAEEEAATTKQEVKSVVADIIKNAIQKAQTKWRTEKENLIAIGDKVAQESIDDAIMQLRLENLNLQVDGSSYEYDVNQDQNSLFPLSAHQGEAPEFSPDCSEINVTTAGQHPPNPKSPVSSGLVIRNQPNKDKGKSDQSSSFPLTAHGGQVPEFSSNHSGPSVITDLHVSHELVAQNQPDKDKLKKTSSSSGNTNGSSGNTNGCADDSSSNGKPAPSVSDSTNVNSETSTAVSTPSDSLSSTAVTGPWRMKKIIYSRKTNMKIEDGGTLIPYSDHKWVGYSHS